MAITTLFEEIENLVSHDIGYIYDQQGGQDGMYGVSQEETDGLHTGEGVIERVCRDIVPGYEQFPLRVYVLSTLAEGGICIIGESSKYHGMDYTILNLGEDDGNFFTGSKSYKMIEWMPKSHFIYMTSRAIGLLNNIRE